MFKVIINTIITVFLWFLSGMYTLEIECSRKVTSSENFGMFKFFSFFFIISLVINFVNVFKIKNIVLRIILNVFLILMFIIELNLYIESYREINC